MKRRFADFIFYIGLCSLLTGCMSAAISGAQAMYGRHGIQGSFNDKSLTIQVDHAIFWPSNAFKGCNISINTFNSIVLLTGQVTSQALHDQLTDIVKIVPNLVEVYNLTTIGPPVSPLVHLSDAVTTAQIKAYFFADNGIDPSQIKVVTENGTVFLMGSIDPYQARLATKIASNTSGVRNVVKVFIYLHASKFEHL